MAIFMDVDQLFGTIDALKNATGIGLDK